MENEIVIRDRIVEFRRVPGHELQDNEGNWRTHPQMQREALQEILAEVGIAGALLVYYSERHGGALTIIDGHMRSSEYPEVEWPCLITDLDDDEADLVLATLDPLAALAETSAAQLEKLTAGLNPQGTGLQAMMVQQRAEADLAAMMAQVEMDLADLLQGSKGSSGRSAGLVSKRARVRPVVWLEDLDCFEAALQATGKMNRGEALAMVCRAYLENHD